VEADAATGVQGFEKPAPKGAVTLVESVDELVDLLHNEAKVI
jgi:electron transfer flavoprotein beta subunit